MMDHRWCKRWKLVVDVQLTSQCGTACVASTRNMSMDGLFVEAPPDSLSAAKQVHIKLPAAVGIPRLEALVIHAGERGVGLMFCAVENQDRHLLARYLAESGQQMGE
jgi:PilZ domain